MFNTTFTNADITKHDWAPSYRAALLHSLHARLAPRRRPRPVVGGRTSPAMTRGRYAPISRVRAICALPGGICLRNLFSKMACS